MSGDVLKYRPFVMIDDLSVDECTIHRSRSVEATWWNLWLHVLRDTDSQSEIVCVPVIPNGSYTENGPGGKSWGLTRTEDGVWQISPSINVFSDENAKRIRGGLPRHDQSIWHHTPKIVGVPSGESWQ